MGLAIALVLLGCVAVVGGVAMLSLPLAVIVAGVLLIVLGALTVETGGDE